MAWPKRIFETRPPRRRAALALPLAGLLLCSCSFFMDAGDGPATVRLFPFEDIALPAGLTFDEEEALVHETPIGRVGRLRAWGGRAADEVVAFYQEYPLRQGWRRVGRFVDGNRVMLVFTKENRAAAITVHDGLLATEVDFHVIKRQP